MLMGIAVDVTSSTIDFVGVLMRTVAGVAGKVSSPVLIWGGSPPRSRVGMTTVGRAGDEC